MLVFSRAMQKQVIKIGEELIQEESGGACGDIALSRAVLEGKFVSIAMIMTKVKCEV